MAMAHHVRQHHLIPLTGTPTPFAAPAVTVADQQSSGAFVATLDGGNPAAGNALYRAAFTGRTGPLTWVLSGTRTGPGEIAGVVPAGYYLWAVSSAIGDGQAWSTPVYSQVTDAAEPLHERILKAAVAVLQSVLGDYVPANNVKRIKIPEDQRVKEMPRPAALLITFGQQEDYPGGTNTSDDTVFPALFSYVTNGLWTNADDAGSLAVRQLVRRAFRSQRLPNVPEVMTCEIGNGPVLTLATADRSVDIQASSMTLKWKCREPRGLGV
jgi:hypothetical protein